MRYHPQSPDSFQPIDLGELIGAWPHQSVKHSSQASGQARAEAIVKGALERSQSTPMLGQSFFAPIWDKLLQSLSEIDHPEPPTLTEAETRQALLSRPNAPELLDALLQAAEAELEPEAFLAVDWRGRELRDYAVRLQLGKALAASAEAVAKQVSAGFVAFCRSLDPTSADCVEELQPLVLELLRSWAQLLSSYDRRHLELNLSLFWSERVCASLECNLQEWQFMFGLFELSLYSLAGPEVGRALHGQLSELARSTGRFGLAGDFARQWPELEFQMPASLPFDLKRLLDAALAEVLLQPNESGRVSPLASQVLQAERPLQAIDPATFEQVVSATINAMRGMAERSSLDWLEEVLERVARALRYRADRAQATESVEKVIERTAYNLREALESYRTSRTLEQDLGRLLDQASQASLACGSLPLARIEFRRWFWLTQSGLASMKTVVSGLRTSIRQDRQCAFWSDYARATELLDEVPALLIESQPILQQLSEPQSDGELEVGRLDRRALRDRLLFGPTRSTQATLTWVRDVLLPRLPADQLEKLSNTFARLQPGVLAQRLPGAVLAHKLWHGSDGIAERASVQIYADLPDYAAQTGPTGPAKCARDSALTLRRVSLAFGPDVIDAGDYVSAWWNSSVNAYVSTRPAQLFRVTLEHLLSSARADLGPELLGILDSTLRPLYESAGTQGEQEVPRARSFRPLVPRDPSFAQADAYLPARSEVLAALLERTQVQASDYANRIKGEAWPMDRLRELVVEGYNHFAWSGFLSKRSREGWRRLPGNWLSQERYLVACLYGCAEIQDPLARLAQLDYLQGWIEYNRGLEAARELEAAAPEQAERLARNLHEKLSQQVKAGVNAPRLEECQRDLGFVLGHIASSLREHNRCVAEFEVYRYLVELFSPYVSYGQEVWQATWEQLGQGLPDGLLARELSLWRRQLVGVGRMLGRLTPVTNAFVPLEEPVFSPSPQEELEWRQLLTGLAALALQQSCGAEGLSRTRRILLGSLPELLRERDFAEKLTAAVDFLTAETDPELRAALIEQAEALTQMHAQLAEQKASIPALVPEQRALHLRAAQAQLLEHDVSNSRWGIPHWVHVGTRAELQELETWSGGLAGLNALEATWSWAPGWGEVLWNPADTDLRVSCQRDLAWTVRRLAVQNWSGRSSGTFEWLLQEVVPYTGNLEAARHWEQFSWLCDQICAHDDQGLRKVALQLRDQILVGFLSQQGSAESQLVQAFGRPEFQLQCREARYAGPDWNGLPIFENLLMAAAPSAQAEALRLSVPEPAVGEAGLHQALALLLAHLPGYEWSGQLTPGQVSAWRSLVAPNPAGAARLERFLVCLEAGVSATSSDLVTRLRLLDLVQRHLELHRRMMVGFEVEARADQLAADEPAPLKSFFRLLGELLTTRDAGEVRLQLHRYWIEELSAAVQLSGTEWRETFERISARVGNSVSALAVRELRPLWKELETAARWLEYGAPIMDCFRNPNDLAPALPKAAQLRSQISTVLALLQIGEQRVEGLHEVELPEQLQSQLRQWLVDLDLRPLQRPLARVAAATPAAQQQARALEQHRALGQRLADRLQWSDAAGLAGLLLSVARSGDDAAVSTRWGIPQALKSVHPEALERIRTMSASEYERLESGLVNSLSPVLGGKSDELADSLGELRQLLERLEGLQAVWEPGWKIGGKDFDVAAFQRDLHWLSRRLAVEGWTGQADGAQTLEWYGHEVLPYSEKLSQTVYQKGIQATVANLKANKAVHAETSQSADRFQAVAEARMRQVSPGQRVDEVFLIDSGQPTADPRKKSIWNRLSDSFEALVGGAS